MTQAIAPSIPASLPAAPQPAGTSATVAAGEGFAAALAQLLGTVPTAAAGHPHGAKSQNGAQSKTTSTASQPDATLIAVPAAAATVVPATPAPTQTSGTSQRTQANAASAVILKLVASAPGTTPSGTTAAQSPTANGQATSPQAQLLQAALQLTPPAVAVAAAPPASAGNSGKTEPKLAAAKHAPSATAGKTDTAAATTDTPTANPKSSIDALLAAATQRAGSQGTGGDGSQASTGKADPAVPQLSASTAPVIINLHTSSDIQLATGPVLPAQAAVPLDALAVNIARKFESGESRFEIHLDPIELGKLDISLTVGDDGRVQAVVRAERPETLDMLQRDARLLEGQLRQSGLNVDSNSLSFSLGGGNGRHQALANGAHGFANALDVAPEIEALKTTAALVTARDGVDIRI